MAAVCDLVFLKFKFLTVVAVKNPILHHRTIFRKDQTVVEASQFLRFSRWWDAAVWNYFGELWTGSEDESLCLDKDRRYCIRCPCATFSTSGLSYLDVDLTTMHHLYSVASFAKSRAVR